jgi:hypothetical protein
MPEPVDAPILKRDPRGVQLQTQIEDLNAALQDWRRTREYSQPTEERLAQITVQCARMVESWQQMERRRSAGAAGPEGRRGGWGAGERRVQQDAGERIRALESAIEHEWETLRDGHEEPARQLREQTPNPTDSSVVAANLTLRGFESVESRLAALEQDLQGRMSQLSRDLQAVVAELRSARPRPLPGATPAFPLESVMRIHEELRGADAPAVAGADALKPGPALALPPWTESATALTARMESLERAVRNAPAATGERVSGWRPRYAVAALLVAVAGIALFSLWMQRRVDTRLDDAAVKVAAAERERDATTAAAREEAARQVAEARQAAAQAQIVGNVLAAPDRVRYWLTGVGANRRAYAQVLVSRSRGMVFSASRLPSAGAGKTYQLWLLTRGGAVSAGMIAPDTAGRVTLATDVPPTLPGRLTGALVTLEPSGGRSRPSADRVLIRVD